MNVKAISNLPDPGYFEDLNAVVSTLARFNDQLRQLRRRVVNANGIPFEKLAQLAPSFAAEASKQLQRFTERLTSKNHSMSGFTGPWIRIYMYVQLCIHIL